jgi:manganese transport protein
MPQAQRSNRPDGVLIPSGASAVSTFLRVLGPGYLVAVGYMDPGNWATDLAAGSRYGYGLLWVVALSSLMAIVLQTLACRLGIGAEANLAELCARELPSRLRLPLWLLAEVAIVACDLAELVGTALALQLLFGLPLAWGVVLTVFDTLVLLLAQQWGMRRLEALVIAMVALVGGCFLVEMLLLQPSWPLVMRGLVPHPASLGEPEALLLAAGILGATVMPHNLYLHSQLVRSRRWPAGEAMRRRALDFSCIDTVVALSLAFLLNAAILVLAGGSFHGRVAGPVTDLSQAYHLLPSVLGTSLASLLFAVALLAAGQSSTLTGTLAGQVVMEGFLQLRLPDWQRRLLTRALALLPAMAAVLLFGDQATTPMLVLSQVVLSLQLPFAVVPLVWFCGSRQLMGTLRAPLWLRLIGWLCAGLIVAINASLLLALARSWLVG